MTDKHNISLSPYQSAILNELGIRQWQLTESTSVSFAVEPISHTAPIEEPVTPVIAPIAELIAIPEQVLLLMSTSEAADPLIKDVLLSLSLDQHKQLTAGREELKSYCDYPLAWLFSEDTQQHGMQWRDNCLTTPSLDSLRKSECKKQLWTILQKHHANAVY
jgi:DNA polymerase III psi subunit